jgi:hypothetical protein
MKKYKLLKYSSEYFFNLGNENRKNAPSYNSEYDDEYHTIFDFNVDFFIKECMFNEPFTKKFFNKFMIMKIKNSSGFIFNYTNEPAKFIITN